jgi:hypothetical protein
MRTQLIALIEMQKIDDKISVLEVQRDKKPQQLEHLIGCVQKAELFLAQIETMISANVAAQKSKESEIKSNKEIKGKYAQQLDGIKNNKEYKALNSQISILDEKNKTIENEILLIMEEAEKLKTEKAEGQRQKKIADAKLKENEEILKAEIKMVESDIERLKEARMEYAKQLPPTVTKKYVQLIQNKNRKAVVYNNNNACSGCGFRIRPQIVIELTNPEKMINCEHCGRILVRSMDESVS